MTSYPTIEKLRRDHAVDDFECGHPQLDVFLNRYAFMAQQAGGSTTYVALDGANIIGFYTLVFGHINHAEAASRLAKGLSQHPIPIMVLARLAVHSKWQGRGVGTGLLRDAMRRTVHASEIAGLRALVVHAKNAQAAAFYAHFGFKPSPTDTFHMYVLLKDVRRMLDRQ